MLQTSTYLLIPIGLVSILLYLFSHLLVRLGVMGEVLHRKIWNVILLLVFLPTAVLGLLLAFQINYKLEWSFVKTMLKWHVDFGIVMSFVAIFHLIWHWKYYFNLGRGKQNEIQVSNKESTLSNHSLHYLIILTGFVGTAVQVLLIRQVTTVFEGNEMMMAWMLGIWMVLTGIGAYLGRQKINFNSNKNLALILLLIGILPMAFSILITILKNQIFPVGVMVSPLSFLIIILLILLPICILIGYLFTLFIQQFGDKSQNFIKVYYLESVGSVVGGLVVSFLLIQWLTITQSLSIILLIIASSIFVLLRLKGYLVLGVFSLFLLISTFVFPFENWLKSFLFSNQRVVESIETHYGNITVTENYNQYNFFANGSLLFTTDNTILSEETVHYTMLQRSDVKNILLVSGGVSGMLNEILKYPSVKILDYVEPNPSIINIVKRYQPLPDDVRLNCILDDGRRFIQNTSKVYDVAILAIAEPSSLQANRYYTYEFLTSLKKRLSNDAVVSYGLPSVGNYISPIKAKVESSVYQTLKRCFKNVEIICGERDYIIASDGDVNQNISQLAAAGVVSTSYVNPYYIDDISIRQRGDQVKQTIDSDLEINTDNKPLPVFYNTLKFSSLFGKVSWLIFILPILLIVPFFFFPKASKGMYVAGFSASSIEILLIFIFQIIYGNLYSAIGMIIALFMGGLALGSWFAAGYKSSTRLFSITQILLGLSGLLIILFWFVQKNSSTNILSGLFFMIITIIPSTIVGFQYVIATNLFSENSLKSAPATYAADLIGSALGVIAITVFLLPLLGLIYTCTAIAGLNIVYGVIMFSNNFAYLSTYRT